MSTARADVPAPLAATGVALALRLTAIELLLRPLGPTAVRPFALGLAALALLSPVVLRSAATWLVTAALVGTAVVLDWPLPDNHIYLLAYWCLAAGLALGAADPASTLARSARLLLGTAFLCAVIWKGALSPDFVDGRFFRVTLLTDERFAGLVQLTTGIGDDALAANRRALVPLPGGAEPVDFPALVETPAFGTLVTVLTWGGLALEASLAVFCLLPSRRFVACLRHAMLLLFCGITYAVAPVAGFGWLLLAMGVALCGPGDTLLRRSYVALWLLVLLYSEVPWAGLLVDWIT